LYLLSGSGVAKDQAGVCAWIRKAAEQGYADAENDLGAFYMSGSCGPKDSAEALRWYREAADQGFVIAPNADGVPAAPAA
jgi:uncharacterized protein